MKLLLILCASCCMAQLAPIFPGRAVTNADMFIMSDNCKPTLAQTIGSADVVIVVTTAANCTAPMLVKIESELINVASISGVQLLVATSGRGWGGTTAKGHVRGLPVNSGFVDYMHNRIIAEIESIEAVCLAGGCGGGGGGGGGGQPVVAGAGISVTNNGSQYIVGADSNALMFYSSGSSAPGGTCTAPALYSRQDSGASIYQLYACSQSNTWTPVNILTGTDAARPTNCATGQMYLSTTSNTLSYCSTGGSPGTWTAMVSTGLGDPGSNGLVKRNGVNTTTVATAGVDFVSPTGNVDFSGATHTLPFKVGSAAGKPATCTQGEMYFATDGAAGQNLYFCTATNTWSLQVGSNTGVVSNIALAIDGGGAVITTGIKGWGIVQANCTLQSYEMVADQSGSIVIDIKRSTYANYPTTASLCSGGTCPTISSAQKSTDTSLTSWTTSIVAGDVVEFVVNSVSFITRVSLSVKCVRP